MLGLHLPNDIETAKVAPHLARLGLISVDFPSFADGRGFSLGRRLRNLGFRGRLRACGPVIADQFAYLLACGYDEVETPESLDRRQPQPQWERALRAISRGYQPGYAGGRSVMQLRHQYGMEP
ncbi:MAG: DUF934 domain-containing protein [Alphaproteobacteria bacterium]|nr:MAG: DUF934 domain-containing protein [Alphaproteobacteria bacterium]